MATYIEALQPLREHLQDEVQRLMVADVPATTGQVAASVQLIVTVLDEFEARLKVLEQKEERRHVFELSATDD